MCCVPAAPNIHQARTSGGGQLAQEPLFGPDRRPQSVAGCRHASGMCSAWCYTSLKEVCFRFVRLLQTSSVLGRAGSTRVGVVISFDPEGLGAFYTRGKKIRMPGTCTKAFLQIFKNIWNEIWRENSKRLAFQTFGSPFGLFNLLCEGRQG